jgi:hypothetical protein
MKWRATWTAAKRGKKDRINAKLHLQEKTRSTRRGKRNLTLKEDLSTVKREYLVGAS